ncbi:SGNH/GDSL hydrolase family protein [Kitasatospora terrestris]|uniref:SGNH hydrolase-type esterase domain-containing protein n=1 Tax=Kitasatospora terrestris TaxID=258051 RepID=A0ABP9DF23_9ACTN
MRTTTTATPRARLAAAAVALGSCLALALPATAAVAADADPVPTVFFGDSYTSNFGIAPYGNRHALCFQANENYPTVAVRTLAAKGVALNVQADVSCSGAVIGNFWQKQSLGFFQSVPAQEDALNADTRLAVGSLGGNTLGFIRILKQCSARLRGAPAVPGEPVDATSPAGQCGSFFSSGGGKTWLEGQFKQVGSDLATMFQHMAPRSPEAKRVLVGYPRLVPQDTAKCLTAAPGQRDLPFADVPQDALPVLDQAQKRLDDTMEKAAADAGADFVDLYDTTGANTACDGADRGIGGLFEPSRVTLLGQPVPFYAHPNEKGRDLQAAQVAARIQQILKP